MLQWLLNAARNSLRHLYLTTPSGDGGDVGPGDHFKEISNNTSLLRELESLHKKLSLKQETVTKILNDLYFLKRVEELFSVYEAEIKLLTDMVQQTILKTTNLYRKHATSLSGTTEMNQDGPDSNPLSTEQVRSTDEFIFSLSKACQQQLEVEKELSHLLRKADCPQQGSLSSTHATHDKRDIDAPEINKMIRSSTSNNPLLLVLRNVF